MDSQLRTTDYLGVRLCTYVFVPLYVCVCACACVGAHFELLLQVLRPPATMDKVQFFLMCFYLWQMRKKSMDSQGTWVLGTVWWQGAAGRGRCEWGRVLGTGSWTLDTGQNDAVIDCALFVAVIALPQMIHPERGALHEFYYPCS